MTIKENTLFDFSLFDDIASKENFITDTVLKQVELSKLMCFAYPNVDILKNAILLEAIAKSYIFIIIAEKLNGAITVEQFAHIFSSVLFENIDNLLSN